MLVVDQSRLSPDPTVKPGVSTWLVVALLAFAAIFTVRNVRAVVVGFEGLGNDTSQLKIAYLEKYSPEFKSLLERAAVAHAARQPFVEAIPSPNSDYYQTNAFVKRLGESVWQSAASPEARQIIQEWRVWHGPAGQAPIISVPSMQ